jgi:drug/metabolite transporter (DMT)-like permease
MNVHFGIFLQILAVLFFTLQGAVVRYIGDRVPLGEIVFARNIVAILPILVMLTWQGKLAGLRTKNIRGHFTRSVTNIGGMFLNFAGFARVPLADATALGYAMPLFTVILAAAFLGEVVRRWRWGAVIVGFLGVLLMLSPHLGQSEQDSSSALGAIYLLAAAFLFGVAHTYVRHMTATETTGALVFYYSVIGAGVGLITVFWGWALPQAGDFIALAVLGFFGGMAQITVTESFRYAPASVLAPFAYSSMLWAVVIGYLWFGEVPGIIVLVGAIIVIGAGLFVIWREHQLGLDKKRAQGGDAPPAV